MNHTHLNSLIDELDGDANSIVMFKTKWGPIWDLIRRIGNSFKETRFPDRKDREKSWNRFQSIINRIKQSQSEEQRLYDSRVESSNRKKNEILVCVDRAAPSEGSSGLFDVIASPAIILGKTLTSGLPGSSGDETKELLVSASNKLKEGWNLFSRYKNDMTGKDKQEVFQALNSMKERQQEAWDRWKASKQRAWEEGQRAHEKRQKDWEDKQRNYKEKHDAWIERTKNHINDLNDRIDKLRGVISAKERNLDKLNDMMDSAWSDEHQNRVSGWISDEEDAIYSIKEKIGQIEGWISEEQSKLR